MGEKSYNSGGDGDDSGGGSYYQTFGNHQMRNAQTTEAWGQPPALETAIAAGKTELLEIGISAYQRLLADGVNERVGRAVSVLRATEALVRFCVYETVEARVARGNWGDCFVQSRNTSGGFSVLGCVC